MNYIVVENEKGEIEFSAKDKPRIDINKILINHGFSKLEVDIDDNRESLNAINKIRKHYDVKKMWLNLFDGLKDGDVLVFQFPVRNHSLFFDSVLKQLKDKNIITIAIIHDLESIRNSAKSKNIKQKIRLSLEEERSLKQFSKIIVHNNKMKQFLNDMYKIDNDKMTPLGMFDYLVTSTKANTSNNGGVIVAGNFKREKAGYIYDLPNDVLFNLYGINYDDNKSYKNIKYFGEFHPDEVAGKLKGKYGLVWDGSSSNTCEGIFGEYLKYNNPHKTSLYLACGLPVIVWDKAAVADFVRENKCGLLISNLNELNDVLNNVSKDEYTIMKDNCIVISKKIVNGYYTSNAVNNCLL